MHTLDKRKLSKREKLSRLQAKVNKLKQGAVSVDSPLGSPCIQAVGTKNASGYVLMAAQVLGFPSPACAHVVSYMLAHGLHTKSQLPRDPRSITGRKQIHHLCAEHAKTEAERKACRSCIQPLHLALVTRRQNMKKSANALKTHCKNGHPLSGDNLVRSQDELRHCVTCNRTRAVSNYRAHKAEFKLAYKLKREAQGFTYMTIDERRNHMATCHPSRKHDSNGLCRQCYQSQREKWRRANDPVHRAKINKRGCERRKKAMKNPEYRARFNARQRARYHAKKQERLNEALNSNNHLL